MPREPRLVDLNETRKQAHEKKINGGLSALRQDIRNVADANTKSILRRLYKLIVSEDVN